MNLRPWLILFVLMTTSLSGCFGEQATDDAEVMPAYDVYPEPWERSDMVYDDSDVFSRVTNNGSYGIDTVRSVFVAVPSITLADGGAGATGGAEVHLGLWLPVIEGCDWEAGNVSAECQVPVIAEVGPYYNDGDVDALSPADRLGRMLIENYVPHGYGVAQVSVFGTGESNHCMDLMGTDEQRGIDAAVTWLGTQGWSNGKVGLIGKSYDGSTPWQAATTGNPHLATIVPMSGLIGVHELMWRNGSMEARGMIMHNGVYGSFGVDGDTEDTENLCEGYIQGYANGPAAYLSGGMVDYAGNDYWTSRSFLDRVLENYKGWFTSSKACRIGTSIRTWRSQPTNLSKTLASKSKPLQVNGLTITQTAYRVTAPFLLVKAARLTPTHSVGIGQMRCCTGSIGTSKAKADPQPWASKCKTIKVVGGSKPLIRQRTPST